MHEALDVGRCRTALAQQCARPFDDRGRQIARRRQQLGRAEDGAVVAEMFTAVSGLGGLLILYSNTFATAKMFVTIIILALLGTGLTALVRLCEQRLAPWKETERARA